MLPCDASYQPPNNYANIEGCGSSDPIEEGCYVPNTECRDELNQEYDWDDSFSHANQDTLWLQVEETMTYHFGQNVRTSDVNNTTESHDGLNEEELENESVNEEQQGVELDNVLVDSDYETDEDPVDNARINTPKMTIDFGFGLINEHEVRNSDTDYNDSDELRSSDSDDDSTSQKGIRREVFNPRIDMEDPIFKVGQIFGSKKVLKDAITEHSVRHNREIKYLKNDAKRLRDKCKQICSWIVYAIKQEDKLSLETKTAAIVFSRSYEFLSNNPM